jgi:enamine deaminase RidA (YjgF/YER057c/UK114 family)
MDNLRRVLESLGLGFADVVSARVFLTHFERDYAAMNVRYASCFAAGRLPAQTTVGVTHLARGGLVEIDLIAAR